MHRLQEKYTKTVAPHLRKEFGYANVMQVPHLEKVVLNIGTGVKDPQMAEVAEETLKRITGQQPVKTKARKSISNFKIREGNAVGIMVTLRGARMYDFLDKLINIALPRVRDFRGISDKGVDQSGNLSIGFKEHISFPEIHSDEVERIHGLQITVVSSATNREEGLALYEQLGFPFAKN